MNTRIRIPVSAWTAAAVIAVTVAAGCDPYQQANKAAPLVIGVTMYDIVQNGTPPDAPGCTLPYPEPDHAWAEATFPGSCTTGTGPQVCPVSCYPPRTGPAFAPYYLGNLGGSYRTDVGGNYVYEVPTLYRLDDVPVSYTADDGTLYEWYQIRVMFNKLMDPQSIQPDAGQCVAAPTLRVFEGTTDVTSEFAVCYEPNSDTDYWGASITATRTDAVGEPIPLNPGSAYRIAGEVRDQQGNTLNVAVTVNTVDPLVVTPAARRAP